MNQNNPSLERVLTVLCEHLYPSLTEKDYANSCCIAGVRCGMEVLQHFGYAVVESTMQVNVMNSEMIKGIQNIRRSNNGSPPTEQQMEELGKLGAFQVIIGGPYKSAENIDSHLVITAADATTNFICDPTIQQAERTRRGIYVPKGVFFRTSSFNAKGMASLKVGHNTYALYKLKPDATYLTSPDWKTDRWKRHAGKMIRLARGVESTRTEAQREDGSVSQDTTADSDERDNVGSAGL
jgi:hypothetical protein